MNSFVIPLIEVTKELWILFDLRTVWLDQTPYHLATFLEKIDYSDISAYRWCHNIGN